MNKTSSRHGSAPSLRHGSRSATAFTSLVATSLRLAIVTGMILLSPGAHSLVAAHAQPATSDYPTALERVDTVMGAVQALRDGIDRTLFEADELAFELAFDDAATISRWVGENIAYQPYRGLLRGPDGTLMTGAGNSLDQAVLLARLLGDAGYTVRIGLGQLDEARAQELLLQASAPVLSSDARQLLESSEEQLAVLAELPGVDGQAFRSALEQFLQPPTVAADLFAEAQLTAAQIVDLVSANGVELGGDLHADLLEEAREYAWVEFRFSPAEEWQQAHPLMADGFEAPEARRYIEGAVPAELQHRLRIEVMIERKLGDSLEVLPVMDTWERPVANAWGTVLTYANVPSGMGAAGVEDIEAVLAESAFFLPQWNGSMAPGATAFDMEGILLEPSTAGNQAAGVFKQVNEKLQSAVGALGALGNSGGGGDPQALTSQWIEYTLVSPGGEERTYRRVVFDRIGEEQRGQGGIEPVAMSEAEARLALMTNMRIMTFPGSPRPEYLLDQFLSRFLETTPFLEYAVARLHGVEPELTAEQAMAEASPIEHLLTVQLFDSGLGQQSGALSYRSQPSLLVYSNGLAGTLEEATAFTSLDIVHNARRMLRREGDRYLADPSAAVEQGVWETIVEREILASSGAVWNTTTAIANALGAGGELRVVEPHADAAALGLPAQATANLQRDLDRGYAAVLPASFPEGERAAWWRVDPATGETLGITADGRGQSVTEYTIQLYDNGLSLVFAVHSLNECEKQHGGDGLAHACCLVKAHVNNVAGMGMGSILSSTVAGALVGRGAAAAGEAGAMAALSFGLTSAALGTDVTGLQC